LLGYLADDFDRELESFVRLDVLAEFSQRQIDYFHALPPALKATRLRATVRWRWCITPEPCGTLGSLDIGLAMQPKPGICSGAAGGGDHSEGDDDCLGSPTPSMARYSTTRAILRDRAASISRRRASAPLAEAPDASVAARRAYVVVLSRIGYEQQAGNQLEDAVLTEQKSIRIATALGARDLTDLDMGAYYAESAGWMVTALSNLGRNDEARKSGDDALAVADKVLELRAGVSPGAARRAGH